MTSETDRIARMLEKTFDGYPWYGNSVQATLKTVDRSAIGKRNGDTHSIIELILHMVSWRVYVLKKLQGDNSYNVTDETNFPKPSTWEKALQQLSESQTNLVDAIRKFPEERLNELVPETSHKYTFYTLIHGIVHHDIYHLGQIAYINKSFTD